MHSSFGMAAGHGRRLTLSERIYIVKTYIQTSSFKHSFDNWNDKFETGAPTKRTCQVLIAKFEKTDCVKDTVMCVTLQSVEHPKLSPMMKTWI